MITDYVVVVKTGKHEFEEAVKFYLKKGYQLYGSMSTAPTNATSWHDAKFYYVQPMTLEEGDEIIEEPKKPISGRCWDCKKLATCNRPTKSPTSGCFDFEAY